LFWACEDALAQFYTFFVARRGRSSTPGGTRFCTRLLRSLCIRILWMIARAKRGRVVQNECEKANRRPTDTATLKASAQLDAKMPKSRSQNESPPVFQGSGLRRFRSVIFDAKSDFMRFRAIGLQSRPAIFDAKMRLRTASLPFKSAFFDPEKRFQSSGLRFRSFISAHLLFQTVRTS